MYFDVIIRNLRIQRDDARGGSNGEYFENLRSVCYSSVAGDPLERNKPAELTGRMLIRFNQRSCPVIPDPVVTPFPLVRYRWLM